MTEIAKRSLEWAKVYRETLQNFVDSLGGNISPAKLSVAKTCAVLSTELDMLTDKLAAHGQGGSAADLTRFMKISDNLAALLVTLGLGKSPAAKSGPENSRAKLEQLLEGIIGVRKTERTLGIFRDRDGTLIDNSGHVQGCECEPCRWLRSRDVTDMKVVTQTPKQLEASSANAAPPRPVVNKAAPPPPIEQATTARFYEWQAAGGGSGISDMSPDPSWPRLR
jgi:hypothetical protein